MNQQKKHDLFEEIQITGIKYLKARNSCIRITWLTVIAIFLGLTFYQIFEQVHDFLGYPMVTNIEAEYPPYIHFPAIAICPNNQYRISYLASEDIIKRPPKDNRTILETWAFFEEVLHRTWDLKAEPFLRKAIPAINTTIASCALPDGSECDMSQWKQIWTINGLCWAFNYDASRPIVIDQPGPSHGLRLILNAEVYERTLTCGATVSTPPEDGFKILIYDPAEQPISTATGVSVSPGVSANLPFRIKLRRKMPGTGCRQESLKSILAADDYFNESNLHTCPGRQYHKKFEKECNCTIRTLYDLKGKSKYPPCDIDQYFTCVQWIQKNLKPKTDLRKDKECLPVCNSMEFIPQQDLSDLPRTLLPNPGPFGESRNIKINATVKRLIGMNPDGSRIYEETPIDCEKSDIIRDAYLDELRIRLDDIFEKRARYEDQDRRDFHDLVAAWEHIVNVLFITGYIVNPIDAEKAKTVSQILFKEMGKFPACEEAFEAMYSNDTLMEAYKSTKLLMTKTSSRVRWEPIADLDLVVSQSIVAYRTGATSKKDWATVFQMFGYKYTFQEEYPRAWKKPIENLLLETQTALIAEKETLVDAVMETNEWKDPQNRQMLSECVDRMIAHLPNEILTFKNKYQILSNYFHKTFSDHLDKYLEKFELNQKFARENLAVVNIYVQSNTIETWTQSWRYSFWSLACDIGGALGLFIGASVASILEVIYVLGQHIKRAKLRHKKKNVQQPEHPVSQPSPGDTEATKNLNIRDKV
ncbi:unnamed protein product, partial [Mesorhabditis spiculigera]